MQVTDHRVLLNSFDCKFLFLLGIVDLHSAGRKTFLETVYNLVLTHLSYV